MHAGVVADVCTAVMRLLRSVPLCSKSLAPTLSSLRREPHETNVDVQVYLTWRAFQ